MKAEAFLNYWEHVPGLLPKSMPMVVDSVFVVIL